MNFEIRPFEIKDSESVSQIIIDNLTRINIADFGEGAVKMLCKFYKPEDIIEYSHNEDIFVIQYEDKITGTIALDKNRIRNLFIHLDYHKKGAGTSLMTFIENTAKEKNLGKLILYSHLSAVEFYKKLGYNTKETATENIDNYTIQLVLMEKYL